MIPIRRNFMRALVMSLLLAELPPAAPESVPGAAHRWQLVTMVTVFVVVGVLAASVRGRSLGATG
jgi:hypothetical protein